MGYRYNPFSGELDRVGITTIPDEYANQYDTDSGSAVPASHIINFLGNGNQGISSSGAGNTVTYTIADATTSQKGVVELATGAETITGTDNSKSVTAESLKAKLGSQTQYGMAYGGGDTNAVDWTAAGTNGQLVIAATGGGPAFGSLTSTGGTVTFTPGPNSLNLEAAGSVAITFDTDSGSATPVANTINLVGNATQGITSSGAGDTVTYTISDASTAQKGVSELATDGETIAGADTSRTIVPSSLTAKLGSQTSDGIPYGTGTAAVIGWTAGLTDGQLVIGSTAGTPAAASLASADSTITITPGSNSIDLATGSAVATSFLADDTNSAVPSSGVLTVTGSGGITTSASGSTLTIEGSGEQIISITSLTNADSPYTVLSSDYYMSCDVSGGTLTIDLPDAPTTGKVFIVKDSGGDANTNNITVTTTGGVVTIDGATSRVISTDYASLQFVFNGTSYEVF